MTAPTTRFPSRTRAIATVGDGKRMGLERFASATGLHPLFVRRLVALDLLAATRDADGELWFPLSQLAAAARLQRLRSAFAINYAGLALVTHLLDRIAELERGARPWTPNG
jgi:hypothetical protein